MGILKTAELEVIRLALVAANVLLPNASASAHDWAQPSTPSPGTPRTTPPDWELDEAEADGAVSSSALWLAAGLGLLSAVTALGNSFVIYAVLRKKYLHSSGTFLLASLAAGDLLVGAVIMPLAILELTLGFWPLGPPILPRLPFHTASSAFQSAFSGLVVCDLYHATDIFASTVSIWSLTIIALDRYKAVNKPMHYTSVSRIRK